MASEHRFTVTVAVDLTQVPEDDDRDEAEFAEAVLWYCGQRRAENTDGWADCVGVGYVMHVEPE